MKLMAETENKEQAVATEPKETTSPKRSHESLFGTLLFVGITLVLVAIVGGMAWGGYRGFRLNKEQTALPSIGSLSTMAEQEEEPVKEDPQSVPQEQTVPAATVDQAVVTKAKGTDIKVLNGGAAKGSATTAAEVLKKEGYTKVATGNTVKDYVGVVVYYAAGLEKEAGVVKTALIKAYPKVEVKAALKDNTETSQAVITVILGK